MFFSKTVALSFSGVFALAVLVSCSGQAPSTDGDASVGGSNATGGQASTGGVIAGGAPATGGAANLGGTTGTSASPCGVCATGELCIYQNGGPGPSHYACATRLPCGAMSPCSCIQNQGTCSIADGKSALGVQCVCDNGLQ